MSGPGLTLTGVDERTPIKELKKLCECGVEIGILYTFDPEDRHRYPSREWIADAVKALGTQCAIHVCGQRARRWIMDHLPCITEVGRVQVNGPMNDMELWGWIRTLCDPLIMRLVTQHNAGNADLVDVASGFHDLLVDGSGGRGIVPEKWERPNTTKGVGFAGGLTPDNLRTELPRIAAVASSWYWVDMESGLRDDDDWFSLDKARRAVEAWREWCTTGVAR